MDNSAGNFSFRELKWKKESFIGWVGARGWGGMHGIWAIFIFIFKVMLLIYLIFKIFFNFIWEDFTYTKSQKNNITPHIPISLKNSLFKACCFIYFHVLRNCVTSSVSTESQTITTHKKVSNSLMSSYIQYSNFMIIWGKLLTPCLFDLDFLRAHWMF